MKCTGCGEEVSGKMKYCPKCGQKIDKAVDEKPQEKMPIDVKNIPLNKKTAVFAAGGAVAVVVLILVFNLLFGATTLKLMDYVTVSYEGVDGMGIVTASIDQDAVIVAMDPKGTFTQEKKNRMRSLLLQAEENINISQAENVKNGDTVSISSEVKTSLLKDFKIKIKNETIKKTVEGLVSPIEISVKDYIEVYLYGIDGIGSYDMYIDRDTIYECCIKQMNAVSGKDMSYTPQADELMDLCYGIAIKGDKDQSILKNGDILTVSAELEEETLTLTEYGIYFVDTKEEITVEGLAPTFSINLEPYADFFFSGLDKTGWVAIHWDKEALKADLEQTLSELNRGRFDVLQEYSDVSYEADLLKDAIINEVQQYYNINVDTNGSLTNGDTITVFFADETEETARNMERYGLTIHGFEKEVTVENLVANLEINLESYMQVTYSGFDGAGTASWSWNYDALEVDLKALLEEKNRGCYGALEEDSSVEDEAEELADELKYAIKYYMTSGVDKETKLSIGDSVTCFCVNEEGETRLELPSVGVTLVGFEKEDTVQALDALQEVDLSEGMQVEVTGICPKLSVKRSQKEDCDYMWACDWSDWSDWEEIEAYNGDTYTFTIPYDEYEMAECGYKVINDTVTITIENQNEIYAGFASIEDEELQPIKEYVLNQIPSVLAKERTWILEQAGCEGGTLLPGSVQSEIVSVEVMQNKDNPIDTYVTTIAKIGFCARTSRGDALEKAIYYAVIFEDLWKTPEGVVSFDEKWNETYLLLDVEELESTLEEKCSYFANGAERMKVVSEASETTVVLGESLVIGEAAVLTYPESRPYLQEAKEQAKAVISYKGHIYAAYDMPMTWEEAKAFCEKAGGHLATITSWEENAIVKRLYSLGEVENYWIGATDEGKEGRWTWITGEPFTFTRWDSYQPDNDEETEHWLEIWSEKGSWNDASNDAASGGFLLEIEPDDTAEETIGYLGDLKVLEGYSYWTTEYFEDSYGNGRYYSLGLDGYENGAVVFDLERKWNTMSAILSIDSASGSEDQGDILIWGDQTLLFSRFGYKKSDAPIAFSLDVSGIKELKIQSKGSISLYLTELSLRGNETMLSGENIVSMNELTFMNERTLKGNSLSYSMDINGAYCANQYSLSAAKAECEVFYLGKKYKSASMDLYTDWNAYDKETSVTIEVWADDSLLFETTNLTVYQGILPVELDLSDVSILEIKTSVETPDSGSQIVYFSNTAFCKIEEEKEEVILTEPVFTAIKEQFAQKAVSTVTHGNSRYYLFDEKMEWKHAKAFCESAGGHLAVITSPEENAVIENLYTAGVVGRYWLGATEEKEEGEWIWVTDEPFEWTKWDNHQPDNDNQEENCLEIWNREGYWNDAMEEKAKGFIMEASAVANEMPDGAYVSDLEWVNANDCEVYSYQDAKTYTYQYKPIWLNAYYQGSFQVNLNGSYERFEGYIRPDESLNRSKALDFAIFGDGKLLYEVRDMNCTTKKQAFSVDVTGINVLSIRSGGVTNGEDSWIILEDAYLIASDKIVKQDMTRLQDVYTIDSNAYSVENSLFCDIYDELHDTYLYFGLYEEAYALYNLEQKYTKLTGSICFDHAAGMDSKAAVVILADDKPVYELTDICKRDGRISFEVDLTGTQVMKIQVMGEEAMNGALCLTEVICE